MSVEQWELDQLAYERQVRRASRLAVRTVAWGFALLVVWMATLAVLIVAW